MYREPVASSNLAAVGYDALQSVLEVEFRGGRIYQYFGVPGAVHRSLMGAPSKGRYLDRSVKPYYQYRRVL